MKKNVDKANLPDLEEHKEEKKNLQGYPLYPDSEDIYIKFKKGDNINPENTSKSKESAEKVKAGTENGIDFNENVSGSDLDVPGSELDDNQEIVGSEDEENNYYSLGGDNHNDLDEDKG